VARAPRVIPPPATSIATEALDPALIRRLVPKGRMISDTKAGAEQLPDPRPDGTRVLFGGRASFRAQRRRAPPPRGCTR
jgi:hypothetical protein